MGLECDGKFLDLGTHLAVKRGVTCKSVCRSNDGNQYRSYIGRGNTHSDITCFMPIPVEYYADGTVDQWIQDGFPMTQVKGNFAFKQQSEPRMRATDGYCKKRGNTNLDCFNGNGDYRGCQPDNGSIKWCRGVLDLLERQSNSVANMCYKVVSESDNKCSTDFPPLTTDEMNNGSNENTNGWEWSCTGKD